MLREVVLVLDADPAGIDQFEEAIVVLHQIVDAIASHSRSVFDHCDANARQPIQEAAFTDVWPANDYNLGNCHDLRVSSVP